MNDKNIVQMPDRYLNKDTSVPVYFVILFITLWGCAAALNDILITQFKVYFR